MVTMADVATMAGVSISTVSHVINGTRNVAEPTRLAVLAAIESMGYTPNLVARSLATARSNLIGMAVSSISNPSFIGLVHYIEKELAKHGFVLLLADPHEVPADELRVVQTLHEMRVNGLMLAPGPDSENHSLRYLAAQRVPTVLIDRLASEAFDQVGVENVQSMATLVQHLAEKGHKRIGFLFGYRGISTTEERLSGYRLGLSNAGLEYEPELVKGVSSGVDAIELVRRLWAEPDPPTGLVVGNDQLTLQALRGLHEIGLRVPDDVAMVSFDDFEWADLFSPRLTTMSQPIEDIAREAVQLLLTRIENPSISTRTVRFPAKFMHRDSCGCTDSV